MKDDLQKKLERIRQRKKVTQQWVDWANENVQKRKEASKNKSERRVSEEPQKLSFEERFDLFFENFGEKINSWILATINKIATLTAKKEGPELPPPVVEEVKVSGKLSYCEAYVSAAKQRIQEDAVKHRMFKSYVGKKIA